MKPSSSAPTLAFDCACSGLSVAVLRGQEVLAAHADDMATGQAAQLAPAIEAALDRAGVKPSELALIAITNGPGSFTGIRIALAMARGLALALELPLAACSTFDAVLMGLSAAQHELIAARSAIVIAAIDSRREEIFMAFAGGAGVERAQIAYPADMVASLPRGAYALVGDGAPMMQQAFAAAGRAAEIVLQDSRPPLAAAFGRRLAAAGVDHWRASNRSEGLPRPLYLRGADVTLPKAAMPQ